MSARPQTDKARPAVIVLGGGHNALGVFRTLGRKGIKVVAVHSSAMDAALFSKFCEPVILPRESADDDRKYVEFLLNLPAFGDSLDVLIPTGDREVLLVARHRIRLESRFRFAMAETATIESLIDKRLFSRLAEAHGLTVPRTYTPEDATDLQKLSRDLPYPCVIKPAYSPSWSRRDFQQRFGVGAGGWIKRIVVGSHAELLETYSKASVFDSKLVIQEYIDGGDQALYDFYSYLDADSEPAGAFMIRKLRTLPIDGNGIGTCVESAWDEKLAETSLRFLRAIRYRGNSAVCFKRHALNGRFYVIEVNARLALHHSLATHCGVDLAYMAYLEAAGEKPPPAAPMRRRVKWLSLADDWRAFRQYRKRGDITLRAWLASLGGEKTHCFFAADDLRPFAVKFGEILADEILGRDRTRRLVRAFRAAGGSKPNRPVLP